MNNFKYLTSASCIITMGLALSSCHYMGPKRAELEPLNPPTNPRAEAKTEQFYKDLQKKPNASETLKQKVELYPGNERFCSDCA
ncbi:hypothetical protein [Methylocucumis oryzae]|uniref:hypothetical protein n=1 Tax=Methylocucumis oryzae TaxID=1632867 RepID=UPI001EF9D1E1|nr:hypothetical protein [Methylocucumis oryzae]